MELTDDQIDKWLRAILDTRDTWKGAHIGCYYFDDQKYYKNLKLDNALINKNKDQLGKFEICPLCVTAEDVCERCVMKLHPDCDSMDDMARCAKIFRRVKAADNIEAAANEALDVVEAELRKL